MIDPQNTNSQALKNPTKNTLSDNINESEVNNMRIALGNLFNFSIDFNFTLDLLNEAKNKDKLNEFYKFYSPDKSIFLKFHKDPFLVNFIRDNINARKHLPTSFSEYIVDNIDKFSALSKCSYLLFYFPKIERQGIFNELVKLETEKITALGKCEDLYCSFLKTEKQGIFNSLAQLDTKKITALGERSSLLSCFFFSENKKEIFNSLAQLDIEKITALGGCKSLLSCFSSSEPEDRNGIFNSLTQLDTKKITALGGCNSLLSQFSKKHKSGIFNSLAQLDIEKITVLGKCSSLLSHFPEGRREIFYELVKLKTEKIITLHRDVPIYYFNC